MSILQLPPPPLINKMATPTPAVQILYRSLNRIFIVEGILFLFFYLDSDTKKPGRSDHFPERKGCPLRFCTSNVIY